MASNKLKTVRKERGPKNLSSNVIASTDIYKIQPIWCRETKKNDIWNIEHQQTNICDALSVPSFIKVKSRNTLFFTPYAKVWQPFESVMGGTSINLDGYTYKLKQMPVLDPLLVLAVMAKNHYVHRVDYVGDGIIVEDGPYDFRLKKSGADEYIKLKFTSVGRRIWNTLQGLGYKLSMFHEYTSSNPFPVPNALVESVQQTPDDSVPIHFSIKQVSGYSSHWGPSPDNLRFTNNYIGLGPNYTYPVDFYFAYYDGDNIASPIYHARINSYSADLSVSDIAVEYYGDVPGLGETLEILPQQLAPSALKLMAYSKVYAENFVPSKYGDICNIVVSSMYNLAEYLQPTKVTFTDFGLYPDSTVITGVSADGIELLENIFSLISSVYYGDDYFTSSPVQAMTSPDALNENFDFGDINTGLSPNDQQTVVRPQDTSDYTPTHKGVTNVAGLLSEDSTPFNVSEYIHNMLHIVTKNIQLKALAGSKLAQRLYALYGGKSDIESREAVALGQNVSDIEVRSITSFADTGEDGAELGQKGGQMNNWNQRKFHVETQQKGCLIYVNQIIPIYFYGQGLHREMMHVKPNDFYNDQFALAGYQNVGRFELFNDDQMGYYLKRGLSPRGTWGKTSAYAEDALRMDNIFGDFALLSRMNLLDAFHFNRFIVDQQKDMEDDKKVSELGLLPINNEDFMKVFDNSVGFSDDPSINHQFDRIFTDSNSNDDHIAQENKFVITVVRDGRNINDFTIGESEGHEVELQGLGKVLYG